MIRRPALLIACVGVAGCGGSSANGATCGPGTVLQNGVCVVAESGGGGGAAGAGTPDAEFSTDLQTMHVNYGATPVAGAEISWFGP